MDKYIFILKVVAAAKMESLKCAVIFKVYLILYVENQYMPGEECIAICEADNYKCNLNIREIKIKFRKAITLVSNFGE